MFRKYTNPLLLVCWTVLSACAPALTPVPATATPTLTLEPTRTPTPAPTTTITPTPTPSLPPELLASLPDGYQIVDNQVIVNGQAWYEMTPEKQWQATDWKILEDAPMKIGWEPEKDWNRSFEGIVAFCWPVLTGEPARDMLMTLNGQEIMVTVLPAKIRDMQDVSIIRNVFIPLIYKDKNGQVLLETWFISEDGGSVVEKTIADFLQGARRGQQLELNMNIYANGKEGCRGSYRCGVTVDLISAQGLDLKSMIVRDGDILPTSIIKNFIGVGKHYLRP